MRQFLHQFKCLIGLHTARVKFIPLTDKYSEPKFYCLCCGKNLAKD